MRGPCLGQDPALGGCCHGDSCSQLIILMDVMVVSLFLAQVSLPASRRFSEMRNEDIFPRKEDGGAQKFREKRPALRTVRLKGQGPCPISSLLCPQHLG